MSAHAVAAPQPKKSVTRPGAEYLSVTTRYGSKSDTERTPWVRRSGYDFPVGGAGLALSSVQRESDIGERRLDDVGPQNDSLGS